MNKIINQKRYDTESAKLLACWNNNKPQRDFSYCSEELYIKKTGEYFLYGEGGPASEYRKFLGDESIISGSDIIPLSLDEAAKWAEEKISTEEYIAIFGDGEEEIESNEEEKERVNLFLPKEIMKSLRDKKDVNGTNLSWLVSKALKDAGY